MSILATNTVRLSWPAVPDAAAYEIYGDVDGQVDYDTPLTRLAVDANPDGEYAIGWGCGLWGGGLWGSSPDAGWGAGFWGCGRWGQLLPVLSIDLTDIRDGDRRFAAVGVDAVGNARTPAACIAAVACAGVPAAPSQLRPASAEAGRVTCTFTPSTDEVL